MIKIGLHLEYPSITPELIHLLKKHPDVEIKWIESDKKRSEYEHDFFETLQSELSDIQQFSWPEKPESDDIDLYIGPANGYESDREDIKCIYTDGTDGTMGVCEYFRKNIVRGAKEVYLPSINSIMAALALMPLAKNLMLNFPIEAVLLLPADRVGSRSTFRIDPSLQDSDDFSETISLILTQLQASFNSPINASVVETTASSFACGIFNTNIKISATQALEFYKDFYSDHRHIYFPEKSITERMVIGTNKTAITMQNDSLGRLVVNIACDALYKGGAGNIVHILNLLFGLDERTGL